MPPEQDTAPLTDDLEAIAPEAEPAVPDAPAPGSVAFGDEPPEIADDARYRDVAGLRDDLAKGRETYKPYHDTFSSMPEDRRGTVLDFAPAFAVAAGDPVFGADVGTVMGAFPQLHPDDQAAVREIVGALRTDPANARAQLQGIAGEIRTLTGQATPAGVAPDLEEPDDEPDVDVDDDLPLTRAELDAYLADREKEREFERVRQQHAEEMLREARDLGYTPGSRDPAERAQAVMLFTLAADFDGDLSKAHEIIRGMDTKAVDKYLADKREDSQRIGPPSGGAPPTGEQGLETLDDADAAMQARLERVYGPDPRRA